MSQGEFNLLVCESNWITIAQILILKLTVTWALNGSCEFLMDISQALIFLEYRTSSVIYKVSTLVGVWSRTIFPAKTGRFFTRR